MNAKVAQSTPAVLGSLVQGLWLLDACHPAATNLTRRKARTDFGAMGIVFLGLGVDALSCEVCPRRRADLFGPMAPGVAFAWRHVAYPAPFSMHWSQ
jgi:hypothetical protein